MLTPQQRAYQRRELETLREEATIQGRRHNDLFASVIVGEVERLPGTLALPKPLGTPDDRPCLAVGGGGYLPAFTQVYLAGDQDDLDAFVAISHQIFSSRIGLGPGDSSNVLGGIPAACRMAELIIGTVRVGAMSLPHKVGPYYPREIAARIQRNSRLHEASPWELEELNEEYIAAAKIIDEHQQAGTLTLAYTLECHLFRGLVAFLNFMLGTLETDEAPAPSAPPESTVTPKPPDPVQDDDQQMKRLAEKFLHERPRSTVLHRLFTFMAERNSATYEEIATAVHGDEETSEQAIRKNVQKANSYFEEQGEPFRFHCGSGRVLKQGGGVLPTE